MTLSDGLTIAAVALAPFFAVFAQKQVELWRENRGRKLRLFKTLMATRGSVVSPEHVQALNMIDLEFTDQSDDDVLKAWRVYCDHLNTPAKGDPPSEAALDAWGQRSEEHLACLLEKMGASLGYKFDYVQIKKGAYTPQAHAEADLEMRLLRRAILRWLTGHEKVSVSVVPIDEEAANKGKEVVDGVLALLKGDRRIKVEATADEGDEPRTAPSRPAPSE